LYLENYEGRLFCFTTQEDSPISIQRSIASVLCYHRDECLFRQRCLNNYSSCDLIDQLQFHSNESAGCFVPKEKRGYSCVTTLYKQTSGIVECKINGLSKRWMFFNSLAPLKCKQQVVILQDVWNHISLPGLILDEVGSPVPKEELITMTDVPRKIYQNITTTFLCQAAAFMYADGIIFEMFFKNGSSTLMTGTSSLQGMHLSHVMEKPIPLFTANAHANSVLGKNLTINLAAFIISWPLYFT